MKQKALWGILILAFILFAVGGLNTILTRSLSVAPTSNVETQTPEKTIDPPKLEITYITPDDCTKCTNIDGLTTFISEQKGNVVNVVNLKQSDEEAQRIIEEKNIEKLPIALITGELDKDSNISAMLNQLGTIVDDTLIVTKYQPPYLDLATGEVKGLVNLVLLYDKNCEQCYDPSNHELALQNIGVSGYETELLEINSAKGKALINQYSIKLVPTMVITGDYEEYSNLLRVWPSVGTQEKNALVFRTGVPAMGTYKNLSTGEIIEKVQKPTTYLNVTPEEFQNISTQENAIILDVRTQKEYDEGHLEGAILIPVDELASRLSELDKDKNILVYCQTGNRSAKASQILIDNGFNSVMNLEKGIVEWENQDLPTVK